jgi:hypothetical protein
MEFEAVRYRVTAPMVGYSGLQDCAGECEDLRIRRCQGQSTSWSNMDLPSTTVLFLSMVIFLA